ncbi:FAD-dependent monooxygenase [Salinactinospora qingdaonensis]|uniref:FAD-binding domain-containing protein n=1 Tax=Salinactinospora qingdaonensis TaxID=702744 RepID=A0ABP7FXL5_9ACTN
MRALKIAIIGGGPAGLFLARLIRLHDPTTEVVLYERNPADSTFGFGVVFSDRTMDAFREADPQSHARIVGASIQWSDMELRHNGTRLRYPGYGFTAVARKTLLQILQEQAIQVGADLRFNTEAPADVGPADIVAIADGANSRNRDRLGPDEQERDDTAAARFIWFGTPAHFDAVTFPFVDTEFGPFAAHAYPHEQGMSTFIVETDVTTWHAAGMAESTARALRPGDSDTYSQSLLAEIFREPLGYAPLLANNSKWSAFRVVRRGVWSRHNMVLLGDAAHTAHFSVGSGTKMAMEDAITLARALRQHQSPSQAFASYERQRRPETARTQRIAEPSMRWWETFRYRMHMPAAQFGMHFLTRAGAINYAGLRRRHPEQVEAAESQFIEDAASDRQTTGGDAQASSASTACNAMAQPGDIGEIALVNRIATYVASRGAAQRRAALAYAEAGSALLALDWTGSAAPSGIPETDAGSEAELWCETVRRLTDLGAAVMAVVALDDDKVRDLAARTGIRLLECALPLADEIDKSAVRAWVAESARDFTVVVGMHAYAAAPWSAANGQDNTFVQELSRLGASAFHLRARVPLTDIDGWHQLLDRADRLRSQIRLPVVLDGPDGWALARPAGPGEDDWPTRMHIAILTGRVDAVAAWPLPRRDRPHLDHDPSRRREEFRIASLLH